MNGMHKNYCFTWNNYPGELKDFNESLQQHATYWLYGYETAPSTGTPHLQGYVQFKSRKRFSTVIKLMPGCDIRVALGSPEQNKTYCSKGGKFKEWGTINTKVQGERSDLEAVKEDIDNGASELEIADNHFGQWCRYYKAFDRYRTLKDETIYSRRDERKDLKVYYWWGVSGSGKTYSVWEKFGDDVFKVTMGITGFWWTGYRGQNVVLMDEFESNVPLTMLLSILHHFPYQVDVHGCKVWLKARIIVLTSNKPLEDQYPNCIPEHKIALRRRFHEITYFPHEYPVQKCRGNNLPDDSTKKPIECENYLSD